MHRISNYLKVIHISRLVFNDRQLISAVTRRRRPKIRSPFNSATHILLSMPLKFIFCLLSFQQCMTFLLDIFSPSRVLRVFWPLIEIRHQRDPQRAHLCVKSRLLIYYAFSCSSSASGSIWVPEKPNKCWKENCKKPHKRWMSRANGGTILWSRLQSLVGIIRYLTDIINVQMFTSIDFGVSGI